MKVGVVGAGILGLTLAHRLGAEGHEVTLLEAATDLGGLAASHDYGEFVWDRFYHCILPQDTNLLRVLDDLGLGGELRWKRTGTGYYAGGRFFDMSRNVDLLRFPLLSPLDKIRLGAAVVYATRFADPLALYRVSAVEWLTRICGRRNYEVFWRPLLKAKFGPFHDRVAAVFIWATLKRLFGARTGTETQEKLGYVSGGYDRILRRFREVLEARGTGIRLGTPVRAIRTIRTPGASPGCELEVSGTGGARELLTFDQVFFTGPTRFAKGMVSEDLRGYVEGVERDNPTSGTYLGVICLVLALRAPLTPYYVLNIAEESVELTGLIEMTNLVDPATQTRGRTLIYLPWYHDSEDPEAGAPDDAILARFVDRGIRRLFPGFRSADAVYAGLHRARYVQPLPLVRETADETAPEPRLERPFQILNTSMLRCATLNNNEVVALVEAFWRHNRDALEILGSEQP